MGVLVAIRLVLPRCEATNLGAFWSASFRPTQMGLCKFGWVWSSLRIMGKNAKKLCRSMQQHMGTRAQVLTCDFNRGPKLNTKDFFSNFSGTAGISQQNPGVSQQKSLISLILRDILNFLAPTPSRGRPPPHPKISGPESLGLGSFSSLIWGANKKTHKEKNAQTKSSRDCPGILGGILFMRFFSPIRNDPKKIHKLNFGTHPVPGQSRTFVYVYVFLSLMIQRGQTDRWTDGQTDSLTGQRTDRSTDGGMDRCMDGLANGRMDQQTDRPTDRQSDRLTDRLSSRPTGGRASRQAGRHSLPTLDHFSTYFPDLQQTYF